MSFPSYTFTVKRHPSSALPCEVRAIPLSSGSALSGTFTFNSKVLSWAASGERLQSGSTVQVMYDYSVGVSVPLSEELRAKLEAQDGPSQAA